MKSFYTRLPIYIDFDVFLNFLGVLTWNDRTKERGEGEWEKKHQFFSKIYRLIFQVNFLGTICIFFWIGQFFKQNWIFNKISKVKGHGENVFIWKIFQGTFPPSGILIIFLVKLIANSEMLLNCQEDSINKLLYCRKFNYNSFCGLSVNFLRKTIRVKKSKKLNVKYFLFKNFFRMCLNFWKFYQKRNPEGLYNFS